MKSIVRACQSLLATVIIVLAANASAQPVTSPGAAQPLIDNQICSNQALPTGYVVTRSAVDTFNCPGFQVVRWFIEPVRNGIAVCLGTPLPSPYFITGETGVSSICSGYPGTAVLSLPTNGTAACANGVVWSPWVITANVIRSQCNGYGIIVIAQAAENLVICSNSPIPSGWTSTVTGPTSTCQPYYAAVLHHTAALLPTGSAPTYHQEGAWALPDDNGAQPTPD